MSEQPHLLVKAWDDFGVPAVLAAGAAVLAWVNARVKRCRRSRAHEHELLAAVAEWAQVSIEETGWRDWATSTNRIHPVSDAEMAEQRGAYRQRRQQAADRLRAVLSNERRTSPRQDVLREADLTEEDRQP